MSDQIQRLREVAEAASVAHRDSYPMGNAHHGTATNPEWGTFCVECIQSWPCEVSLLLQERAHLLDRLERAEAAVERVRKVERRLFFMSSFEAHAISEDIEKALDGGER